MRDVHCHILPGVDDGSRSMDESLEMIRAAMRVGITRMTCTPHCRDPWFDYEKMWDAFHDLEVAIKRARIPMPPKLSMGFEVNYKKLMELGEEWIEFLACETGDFLLEFPNKTLPSDWERIVYTIQSKGYSVIIAHPERYCFVQSDIEQVRRFIRAGCKVQVSADFCSEGKFSPIKKTAKALLSENLVNFIASDAHNPAAYEFLWSARKEYSAWGAHARL